MADDQDDEYEVGYKKPPKQSVFKKGHRYYAPHSRNPKKSRGEKTGRSVVARVISAQVRAKVDRRVRRISRFRAFLLQEMQAALKGDANALLRAARRGKRFGFFDRPTSTHSTGVVVVYSPTMSKAEWLAKARAAKRSQANQPVAVKKKG